MTALYRIALILAAGVVSVAGHWGGSIVYGEDYRTEVLFPKPACATNAVISFALQLKLTCTIVNHNHSECFVARAAQILHC